MSFITKQNKTHKQEWVGQLKQLQLYIKKKEESKKNKEEQQKQDNKKITM